MFLICKGLVKTWRMARWGLNFSGNKCKQVALYFAIQMTRRGHVNTVLGLITIMLIDIPRQLCRFGCEGTSNFKEMLRLVLAIMRWEYDVTKAIMNLMINI